MTFLLISINAILLKRNYCINEKKQEIQLKKKCNKNKIYLFFRRRDNLVVDDEDGRITI
jgi:hypothetical protein